MSFASVKKEKTEKTKKTENRKNKENQNGKEKKKGKKGSYFLAMISIAIFVSLCVFSANMYMNLPKNNYTFNSRDYKTFTLNQKSKYAIEEYEINDNKITCHGWFALNEENSSECRKMTVFLSTADSHLFYKMKTERKKREDVNKYLKKRIPEPKEYRESGFSAEISTKNIPSDTYSFYVYYESAQYKVLKKLPYKIKI